jgi:hypothetical protein
LGCLSGTTLIEHQDGRAAPIQSPQARHARWMPASTICQALVGRTLLRLVMQCQRRILIRWEFYPKNFLGFVQLACLLVLFKRF